MKKKGLGKGLSALIPDSYENVAGGGVAVASLSQNKTFSLPLEKLLPNPNQPRYFFDEERLEELADSIREKGVLQPLIVRDMQNGKYEIVCGERRYRAAEYAGLKEVPVIIKDLADDEKLEIAIIENVQRADLTPLEEAEAYLKLMEKGYSQEEVAKRVGKSRSAVANILRLLRLPKEVLKYIASGELSEGHARALLSIDTDDAKIRLMRQIMEEGLSVRQVEEIVKRKNMKKRPAKKIRQIDSQIMAIERKIEERLGSKVRLFAGKKKGRIEIHYFSLDDLDRILSVIGVSVD